MLIKYLVLSDIHLGHTRNITSNIVNNLQLYFKENHKLFKTLDLIFIAGDIFDRLLSANSKEYSLIMKWLTSLVMYCKHNSIGLRVLEGTPGHDRGQGSMLSTILEELKIEIDYKYIDTLYIERNEKLGIDILYVPDEYKHSGSEVYEDVKLLLAKEGIEKVDIAIMHGAFHYQLPVVLESSHSEEDYLKIVRQYISIGHIHTSSVYSRILAQGSFDRLSHGEEEKKGGMVVLLREDVEDSSYVFIENKHAMIFESYDYSVYSSPTDNMLQQLLVDVKKLPGGSHVRLLVKKGSVLSKSEREVQQFLHMNLTKSIRLKVENLSDSEQGKVDRVDFTISEIESFSITEKNICELLYGELQKYELSKQDYKIVGEELANVGVEAD